MTVETTPIKDLLIVKPTVFSDPRGYFFESYNTNAFKQIGIEDQFVQDNQSLSEAGVLRGLHFQKEPYAQGKLVRVIKGAVLDVAVDIRKDSTTYGNHFAIELNEENKLMLWIPKGFAHGFLTLKNNTIFSYKCTNFYYPNAEVSILWEDPSLGINWGIKNPQISNKDRQGVFFHDLLNVI